MYVIVFRHAIHTVSRFFFSRFVSFYHFYTKHIFALRMAVQTRREVTCAKRYGKNRVETIIFIYIPMKKKRPLRQSTEFLTFVISVCTICKFLQPLFLYAQSASLQHTYTLFFTQMHCKHIAFKPNGTSSLLFNSVEFNLILVSFLLHTSEYVCSTYDDKVKHSQQTTQYFQRNCLYELFRQRGRGLSRMTAELIVYSRH